VIVRIGTECGIGYGKRHYLSGVIQLCVTVLCMFGTRRRMDSVAKRVLAEYKFLVCVWDEEEVC
jgi:hypothetical protein